MPEGFSISNVPEILSEGLERLPFHAVFKVGEYAGAIGWKRHADVIRQHTSPNGDGTISCACCASAGTSPIMDSKKAL